MTDSVRLRLYMGAVVAAAVPLIGLVVSAAVRAGRSSVGGRTGIVVAVFCVVLVVGEMWPIPVARGEQAGDEITVSSTFGFGLLLIAPVCYAVLAQAVALTIEGVLRRRPLDRLVFNIAQYAIAFVVARGAYALFAGRPFTPHVPVPLPNLIPALGAGAVFMLANNSLVGIAVSISVHLKLARVLVDDLKWQVTTSAPLLGLGPLAVQAMFWTPLSIGLLLMPIVALHHSGKMAMRREKEAFRDALTGLANRAMLHGATERALSASTSSTAMLLLDLDHFKDINDTLGHCLGDQMLIAVAERLTRHAGLNDLVARLGGDEFVVLARGVEDRQAVVDLAERLCRAVREPVVLNGVTLTVGCSVGIAFGPEQADNVSDLLRCADVALYTAKVTRGNAAVYRKEVDRHSAARLGLQADLRLALENPYDEQLWVAFQPQRHLHDGAVRSVECLVRWRHPELGDVDPEAFIPIAESTSLIDLVLDRVLDASLGRLAAWDAAGLHLDACVNLSARQLSDMSLPERVRLHLARHGLPAHRLVLEVTESRLMSDPEHSATIVQELHNLGVQMSIDDFGTGYSSLAYLQRLAVDELKIDKSFITRLHEAGNATIVRSTIELGHNLGLRMVAEGVEDERTADRLARMGCDVLQGYLIGRPVAADDLISHLAPAAGRSSGVRQDGTGLVPASTASVLELFPSVRDGRTGDPSPYPKVQ